MNPRSRDGFNLVELLVIIAILGFLGAVLVPTVGTMRCGGRRTVDASNIRQLGQAALIYANDNGEQLPGLSLNQEEEFEEGSVTPNIHAIAAALARQGGLNDPSVWISNEDRHPGAKYTNAPILRDSKRTLCPDFARTALSFQFIAGLNTAMPSPTPIAFTRGLQPEGQWAGDQTVSVYGREGGHIVFLGGNVIFYKDLGVNSGILSGLNEKPTPNVRETIDSKQRIFSTPPTPTGTIDGLPGIGERNSKAK